MATSTNFQSTQLAPPEAPTARQPQAPAPRRRLRDLYCEAHGLPSSEFVEHFLPGALHMPARMIYPLARLFNQEIDKNDRELVEDIGTCDSRSAIRETLNRLPRYYSDWNFWRSQGKFRISSRKISARVARYGFPS